ncbi:MAG: PIN domain-containing protein [Chloroflexi bacterium]|nr:PIN domain-containing protein [Chloroflexota bacterium]
MGDKLRVLVDVNIVLDVLAERQPHYEASARVWAAVESGVADGLLAAHTLTTLFYLLSKHSSRTQATQSLHDLLNVFSVAQVDEGVIRQALALGWVDFEDAAQMAAASSSGADYLITRNPKDFEDGLLPVLQPGDLLALLRSSE